MGEFKDDQIQNLTGEFMQGSAGSGVASGIIFDKGASSLGFQGGDFKFRYNGLNASRVARAGTTTHGKQLGVNFIIKY